MSKVSSNLPEKQQQIENYLRDLNLYYKLSSWASSTKNLLEQSPEAIQHKVFSYLMTYSIGNKTTKNIYRHMNVIFMYPV